MRFHYGTTMASLYWKEDFIKECEDEEMNDDLKKVSKAHTIYKLQDGSIIPGVTTVLGILAKPQLIKWANNLGLQGIDSSKYTDAAARIGTLAHYMVQCHITKESTNFDDYSKSEIDQAENALISFFEWEKGHTIEPILNEIGLVSSIHKYGGTIDCYANIDGKKGLIDFKTGKAIYSEMIVQLAAYKNLLIENGYPVENVRIIRMGRTEDEGFDEKVVTDLDNHWDMFKGLLSVYNLQKIIDKAV